MSSGVRQCRNCKENVTVRDEREGLIHTNGLYRCAGQRDQVAE